jgi:hypothetical protein
VETIFGRFIDPLHPRVSNGFFGGTGVSDCTVTRNHLSLLPSPSEAPIRRRNDQAFELNKRALTADASRGEEYEASSQGSNGKGWTIGLREPQRDALIPPIEGQTGVGYQLVRGEPGRSLSRKDRGDNIGCEKGQPHSPRRVRSRDLLLPRDGFEGWAVRFEHSLGDLLTAYEHSDQGRIHWRRIGDALDDELHLFAGSLDAREDDEPAQSLFGGRCHRN